MTLDRPSLPDEPAWISGLVGNSQLAFIEAGLVRILSGPTPAMYSVNARGIIVRLRATDGRFLLDGLESRSLDLIGRLCKLYSSMSYTRKGLFRQQQTQSLSETKSALGKTSIKKAHESAEFFCRMSSLIVATPHGQLSTTDSKNTLCLSLLWKEAKVSIFTRAVVLILASSRTRLSPSS